MVERTYHEVLSTVVDELWQTFSCFTWRFFAKVLLPIPSVYEIKELEDSPDNRTFALISQRISSGITWFINNLNLSHLAR
jgi:hypothetical protein